MLATKDDFDFFLFIKSEKFNVDWTGGSSRPIEENLKKFFYNTVEVAKERLTRKIYIIKKGKKALVICI